jgi:hypothetical protein
MRIRIGPYPSQGRAPGRGPPGGVRQAHLVTCHSSGQVVCVDTAAEATPGGDGAGGARGVVLAGGGVDPGRLGYALSVLHQLLDRIVKPTLVGPSGGPGSDGQRCKFAAVGRRVERENDQPNVGRVPQVFPVTRSLSSYGVSPPTLLPRCSQTERVVGSPGGCIPASFKSNGGALQPVGVCRRSVKK